MIIDDGVVPRFVTKFTGKKKWIIREQPLFDNSGQCVWADVFSDDIIEELKVSQGSGFDANYLLIPYVNGQTIIPRSLIKTVDRYPV